MNPDTTARQVWINLAQEHGWLCDELTGTDVVVLMKGGSVIVASFDMAGGLVEAKRLRPSADSLGSTSQSRTFEGWLLDAGPKVLSSPLPVESPAQIVDFEHLRTFARFLVGGFPPGGTVKAGEVGRMIQRFVEPQPEIQS